MAVLSRGVAEVLSQLKGMYISVLSLYSPLNRLCNLLMIISFEMSSHCNENRSCIQLLNVIYYVKLYLAKLELWFYSQ